MKKLFISLVMLVSCPLFAAQNFIFCMEGSPSSFNPQIVTDGVSMNASAQAIFNRLVEFKYGGTEVIPSLAESWTVSKDKKLSHSSYVKMFSFNRTQFLNQLATLTQTM